MGRGVKATLYFDGACHPNPGAMGIGVVLDGPDGVLAEISERLPGQGTNNVAEYTAIIRGMETAQEKGVKDLVVRGDSNLVVQQMLGKFRVREPRLRPFLDRVGELAKAFDSVDVQWIPREKNGRADKLSYQALADVLPAQEKAAHGVLGSKPSAREHSILCPRCGKPCELSIQTFKDGSEHVRQECPDHGYVGYAPNVEPFLTLARQSTKTATAGNSKP